MNKTITEVRKAKQELEAKITQLLLDFENENRVRVSDCYYNSHHRTAVRDDGSVVELAYLEHDVEFEISVSL